MRRALHNQVLQGLIDAAGKPVPLEGQIMCAPRSRLVIPDLELGGPEAFGYDDAAGSAFRVVGRPEPANALEIGAAVAALRGEGWVIATAADGNAAAVVTYQLRGRTPLPPPASLAVHPPEDLPQGRVERARLCLLAAGAHGRPHGVIADWVGELLWDTDYSAIVAGLRDRGYQLDTWAQGSTRWYRIIATPDVPMAAPSPPGSDARMIPARPGDPTPDPVGATEIAARAGVQRTTVERWTQRHDTFPDPQWTIGGRPAYDWHEVVAWRERTGRTTT